MPEEAPQDYLVIVQIEVGGCGKNCLLRPSHTNTKEPGRKLRPLEVHRSVELKASAAIEG